VEDQAGDAAVEQSRREFVAQCAAAAGASAVSAMIGPTPAEAAGQGQPLFNWAGNHRYGTTSITSPTSLADVQAFVRRHARFKVLGTRHCFNGIADSTDAFLSLREMHHVVALDRTANTVTIEAGMSYGQLCPVLDRDGFALHNLASLPHISVAGACATGTHGSGVNNGNLSTAVSAFELVTAAGDVVTFARSKDLKAFQAAVVNLGALGVVTKVTLDVQPTYQMRQDVYLDLPMAQVRDHFEDIVAAGYSVSLFTDWQKGRVNEVWVKRRLDHGTPAVDASRDFYGAKAATANVHPIVELSAENCTAQMGVAGPWYERLPHFRMGFTPSSGKELQSEYFVPRKNAVDAIAAVERLRDHVSPHLMISELRTIAADELWMSPAYQRPSLAIHFTWKQDWESVRRVLPMIERELAPFDVRPHWGKLFTIPSAQLLQRYPMAAAFTQLVAEHDPKATFRNAFLAATLYG
jgi:xylitol oxidase